MIKRIELVVSWFRTVTITATSVATLKILNVLTSHSTLMTAGYLVSAVVGIVILARVIEAALTFVIGQSERIRTLIMGGQFVEGYWVDRLVDVKTKEIISIGIIRISYDSGMLVVDGSGYSPSYESLGSFRTYISRYDALTLQYGYESILPFSEDVEVHGHGNYRFLKASPHPIRFNGVMQDSHFKNKILLEGRKIVDKSQLAKIEDDGFRSDLVKNYSQRNTNL